MTKDTKDLLLLGGGVALFLFATRSRGPGLGCPDSSGLGAFNRPPGGPLVAAPRRRRPRRSRRRARRSAASVVTGVAQARSGLSGFANRRLGSAPEAAIPIPLFNLRRGAADRRFPSVPSNIAQNISIENGTNAQGAKAYFVPRMPRGRSSWSSTRWPGLSGLGDTPIRDIPTRMLASNADWNAGRPGTYKFHVVISDLLNSQGYTHLLDPAKWNERLRQETPLARVTKVAVPKPAFTNIRENAGFWDQMVGKQPLMDLNLVVTVELASPQDVGPGTPGTVGAIPALAAVSAVGIAKAVLVTGVVLGAVWLAFSVSSEAAVTRIETAALRAGKAIGGAAGGAIEELGKGLAKGLLPLVLVAGGALLLAQRTGTKVRTKYVST